MSSPLSLYYVLLQESFDEIGPNKMQYRAGSYNFNYIFHLGRSLHTRQPMRIVGIVVCNGAAAPFTCRSQDLHLMFITGGFAADVIPPTAGTDSPTNLPDDLPF